MEEWEEKVLSLILSCPPLTSPTLAVETK